MNILLDENLPKRLKSELVGHSVYTVPQKGWAGIKNGALLKLVSASDIDVFVTMDGNLQYQQNLKILPLRFVVLVAINNSIETLKPLMPRILEVIDGLGVGEVIEIGELPNNEP